jgi:hypothetical protein
MILDRIKWLSKSPPRKRPVIASLSDFHVTRAFQAQREDCGARGLLAHHVLGLIS